MHLTDNFRKNSKTVLIHIIVWLIYMAIGTTRKLLSPGYHIDVLDIILTELPMITVFYLNYVILVNFLSKRKYLLLIVAEVLLFVVCLLLYYVTGYIIGPLVNSDDPIPEFVLTEHVIYSLWLFMIYEFYSFGYYYAREAVKREKQLRSMDMEKLRIEQNRLQAEYAFLRVQINPHFLHNTLNFFYAKSLPYSRELSEGILTLCEIMRYSLNSGEDEKGTVLLAKEVEHINNVIKINQLRFSNRLKIDLFIEGDAEMVRIIPLVLITLVENAFKHGELTKEEHPLVIKLAVSADNSHIYFSTHNRKKTGPKELSHGIGMDNIRKRLYAAYKEHCSLAIKDEAEYYTVELSIDLAAAAGSIPASGSRPKPALTVIPEKLNP
jgi:sensor histidine kinase YesM